MKPVGLCALGDSYRFFPGYLPGEILVIWCRALSAGIKRGEQARSLLLSFFVHRIGCPGFLRVASIDAGSPLWIVVRCIDPASVNPCPARSFISWGIVLIWLHFSSSLDIVLSAL